MSRIYLDHVSATPVLPEAQEAMRPWLSENYGNPASGHWLGLQARRALQSAREKVAALLHAASAEEIIFTSSGTEAVNLAVQGMVFAARSARPHVVVTAVEQPAVIQSATFLRRVGATTTLVPVDSCGFVDPEAVRKAITEETALVCVQHANADIGTLQRLKEIVAVAAEKGVTVFADANVSAGWHDIDVQALGVDLLSVAPHRFYGPKGVGALYRHRRARLTRVLHGGDQENGKRAGTENVPAIVGAGVAAEAALRDLSTRIQHVAALQQALWDGVRTGGEHAHLNGPALGSDRLANNLNLSFAGIEGEALMLRLDMEGIAVASGAACVTRSLRIPPVLAAIGLSPALARGNLILSLGKDNTAEEMRQAANAITRALRWLREQGVSTPRQA